MVDTYTQNIEKYYAVIREIASDYVYRAKRYHVNFALAVGFCAKKDIVMSECIEIKRKTDRLIHLEENLCCMLFDCIDEERIDNPINNIKQQIEQKCDGEATFMDIVTFNAYENDYKMINALLEELDHFLLNESYNSL